jgi:exopolyphosphatase/guanosine-5'-triphosphate,3'-diphosphate pyrophosphatase
MRLAIIDLGTNSIRFDIHEISANRTGALQHRRLYREKAMVRLGQNLFLEGKLNPQSRRRTLEAISSFAETMNALKVDRTIAFGTAAMRDASDGEDFLAEIKAKTSVDFRIISGAEEASLIAKGVMSNEVMSKTLYALIDIGGGSTEVSICKGLKTIDSYSFNLGVAKLQQIFLKSQPPVDYSKLPRARKKKKTSKKRALKANDPVLELRNFIKSIVLPKILIERWPKVQSIVGSSGSVIAMAKLINKDKDAANKPFSRKNLSKAVDVIKTKTAAELLSMRGMEPKRVDLILAGGVLLDEMALLLGAKTIRATEFALRDGILADELNRYSQQTKKTATFSIDEVEKRAQHWGIDESHYRAVKTHCDWLFDKLKSVHGLKAEWKPYLIAAAILHDVGETISHAHHAEHSEYMVKNANFVGMRPWESHLIASLCRFHKEEKILEKKSEKKIPFEKRDELRVVFLKLLSILQMADAIDRTHKKVLTLKKIRLGKKQIDLSFTSKYPCDLEILRFEQKKVLFEALFKKEVLLARV